MQLRYTYIDYKYTGSDLFFGASGNPMDVDNLGAYAPYFAESSSDFRAYLRYRY